jgi:hypothetical protein
MRSWVSLQFSRVVVVLSLGALSPGCLIGAPDELEGPQRLPPRALVDKAIPVVTQVVQTSRRGDKSQFNVQFVSFDLGESVLGRLFLNYPDPGPSLGSKLIPPSADDTPRELDIFWDQRREVAAGCYTVTLTISHVDNYSQETLRPIDLDKTAFVTWWVAHDIPPQLVNLDECGGTGIKPE